MATYDYHSVVSELVQRRITPARQVFLYEQHRLAQSYEQFFQFAQVNLSEVCRSKNYNIDPARFYYPNGSDVNACAIFDQGYYIIEVNRGTLEQLFALFCDNNPIHIDAELADYQRLNEILEAKPHNVSLCYLLYQNATLFTYYHELGHLIQYSNEINGLATAPLTKSIQEHYMASASAAFDPLDHVVEYDADLHGANSIAFHIIDLWERLGPNKTEENLRKLTVTSMVSVLGYITLLWDFGDLYYEEHDHPHPLIRIAWILTVVVDRIKAYEPTIDQRGLIVEALHVLNVYYRHLGQGNVQDKLINPFMQHHTEIMAYAHKVMQQAQAVPYLASNTVHRM